MDLNKFQMKRVNPFQGLVIDADTWQDAHNYHRDQQRLHVLAFHDTGIVSGLEVTANNPPDSSININPGMAIDQDGNVIVVPRKQRYNLQATNDKGTVYIIIQFREIPGEPLQPPEGGQPTRILEAYRIQERVSLPTEGYIELARIDYNPVQPTLKDAGNFSKPALSEIDMRFRKNAKQVTFSEKAPVNIPVPQPIIRESVSKETVIIGHSAFGDVSRDLHINGLKRVIKELNRRADYTLVLEDQVNLYKSLERYGMIYLTGNGRFELTADQQTNLTNYLQSGGVVFGDGCSRMLSGTEAKGAKEFGLAFNRVASKLNCKLGMVKKGHPLLDIDYMFADVPQGSEPAMLLEGGNMICSSSDYGCAWEGGREEILLSREIIRSALEMGSNLISYAINKTKVGK